MVNKRRCVGGQWQQCRRLPTFSQSPNFSPPTVLDLTNTFSPAWAAFFFFIKSSPFLFRTRRPATPLPLSSLLPKSELCMLYTPFFFNFFIIVVVVVVSTDCCREGCCYSAIMFTYIFNGCKGGCLFRKLFGTAISRRLLFGNSLFVLQPQGNLVCLLCTTQKLNF